LGTQIEEPCSPAMRDFRYAPTSWLRECARCAAQIISATLFLLLVSLKNTSFGVANPKVFRGRLFLERQSIYFSVIA